MQSPQYEIPLPYSYAPINSFIPNGPYLYPLTMYYCTFMKACTQKKKKNEEEFFSLLLMILFNYYYRIDDYT